MSPLFSRSLKEAETEERNPGKRNLIIRNAVSGDQSQRNMGSEKRIPPSKLAAVVKRIQQVKEILPVLSKDGRIVYPALDEFDRGEHEEIVNEMQRMGYLAQSTTESLLACPKCHKSNIVPILKCPKCKSASIKKERLIEHKTGGHIHLESAFKQKGGFVCPTCGKALSGEDEYRPLGGWFDCVSCGEKSAQIMPEFKCQDDGTGFSTVEAEIKQLAGYKLTDNASTLLELDKEALLEVIVSTVPKGITVTRGFSTQGKSGAVHAFDVSVSSNGGQKLIDVAFSKSPVEDMVLLACFAKVFDIGSEDYVLIAWPGLTPSSRKLAGLYKIRTLEASNAEELKSKIGLMLAPSQK